MSEENTAIECPHEIATMDPLWKARLERNEQTDLQLALTEMFKFINVLKTLHPRVENVIRNCVNQCMY